MTSELERIKILESKISQVVNYINKLTSENESLKEQVRELKAMKKSYEDQAEKMVRLDGEVKKFQEERELVKGKIDAIINQIDKLGI